MSEKQDSNIETVSIYQVWDKPVRIFHWINLVLITALMFVGLIMLFKAELGISGLAAKIKLKELHIVIGYLFVINLLVRLLWGVIGSGYAKLSHIWPSFKAASDYQQALKAGKNPQYLGHNPLGKLAVSAIFALLIVIGATGLLRAGTDVFYPPFGAAVTEYIAADGVDPASLKPYDDTGVDQQKVAQMKPYKSVTGKVHLYGAYLLMLVVLIHIIGVIIAELKHQPGIISAMFSGKKRLKDKPVDE
ncbi:cytochrome b/b6 domain-containing protein [Shewanella schlegeliana]|uniref:Cytochrome b/b6 domain-containing protein n=1 Tax=Shewanella schlegeliana TaxID=190308 RepID=A0ABS1SXL6_9GAMM|nr:cytochrome b/b6 domain-containing protein [Shewanella schlegeliana]MBL4913286.1 cytochrome b/b6 domain-containing protein [Shewanella schlegeliana]MCL1109241.1 cytochrome b/b6 domain-containing protein [Shewanella schlegeliana]GIU24523.1 cytochrome b561 [Shewanella schlegeliana]